MFEYRKYPQRERITINPKFIVSICYEAADLTKISTADGNIVIVQSAYEDVIKEFNSFMYSIQTIVSVR